MATIFGTDGNDLLGAGQHRRFSIGATLSEDFSQYFGGEGNDTICGGAIPGGDERLSQPSEIHGGNGDDEIYSGQRVDAGAGNDFVYGGTSDAIIFGGADLLQGGYGSDTMLGGAGRDVVMVGSSGAGMPGFARGGIGDDVVYGNFSSDASGRSTSARLTSGTAREPAS